MGVGVGRPQGEPVLAGSTDAAELAGWRGQLLVGGGRGSAPQPALRGHVSPDGSCRALPGCHVAPPVQVVYVDGGRLAMNYTVAVPEEEEQG